MLDLRRRQFIRLLGGAAAAWPLAARAQQAPKQVTIGLLGSGTATVQSHLTAAFVQRLAELGWIEGRNVTIEYRWAEGHTDRLPQLADELVRLRVDVILTHNTPPTLAAKRATSVIPIVFATAGDAVSTGIVASLARPGGNVTGLSSLQPQTAGKRIEVLRELIPGLRRLAILTDVGNPFAERDVDEVRSAARTIAIEVETFEIRRDEDIAHAFEAFQGRVQALYVPSVPLLFANSGRINTLALTARLPTMHGVRELVEAGGLISYGPHWPDMWRRSADFVDKILRGAKPAELPVEQPIKFELVVNMKTAKAIGLTVPDKLIALADEVIE
jgi:putative tryptophan/tyrosine transport system substrate-binding protein